MDIIDYFIPRREDSSSFIERCKNAFLAHKAYRDISVKQKDIKSSLQSHSVKQALLRKRNFDEMNHTSNFGSGSGRKLNNWVLSTSYLQSYQS